MKKTQGQLKKINKISKIINLDKFLHNNKYFFDNGQVEEIEDIIKGDIKYSIIKLNKDIKTSDYLVYVLIIVNKKTATHQLLQEISGKTKSTEYFRSLKRYIKNTTNDEIIDRCFNEMLDFPRKNILTRIFGF